MRAACQGERAAACRCQRRRRLPPRPRRRRRFEPTINASASRPNNAQSSWSGCVQFISKRSKKTPRWPAVPPSSVGL
eukprot:4890678-Pyramimonas_sp.AAC.1